MIIGDKYHQDLPRNSSGYEIQSEKKFIIEECQKHSCLRNPNHHRKGSTVSEDDDHLRSCGSNTKVSLKDNSRDLPSATVCTDAEMEYILQNKEKENTQNDTSKRRPEDPIALALYASDKCESCDQDDSNDVHMKISLTDSDISELTLSPVLCSGSGLKQDLVLPMRNAAMMSIPDGESYHQQQHHHYSYNLSLHHHHQFGYYPPPYTSYASSRFQQHDPSNIFNRNRCWSDGVVYSNLQIPHYTDPIDETMTDHNDFNKCLNSLPRNSSKPNCECDECCP